MPVSRETSNGTSVAGDGLMQWQSSDGGTKMTLQRRDSAELPWEDTLTVFTEN
jgi:hypothetical protein